MGKYYTINDTGQYIADITNTLRQALKKGHATSITIHTHNTDNTRPKTDQDITTHGTTYHCNWELNQPPTQPPTHQQIMDELEKNPTQYTTTLAKKLKTPTTTIHDTITKINQTHTLTGLWIPKQPQQPKPKTPQ